MLLCTPVGFRQARVEMVHQQSFASSFWGTASLQSRLAAFSSVAPHIALGKTRELSGRFVIARKKSGFAEILLNRRLSEKEKTLHSTRPLLKRGTVSPRLPVPSHIPRPPYVTSPKVPDFAKLPQIQDSHGINCMRASGRLAAEVLNYAGTLVKPGVTTDEIDKAVHNMIIEAGAYPSPLGYGGFPKSVCTSVNECICHGIPDSRPLEDGDIINIDVTVYLNGYHGDTSKMFLCGTVNDDAKKLVEVTRMSLEKAIAVCGPGIEFKQIGKVINDYADQFGYGVVRHFVGHGVGKIFHSAPAVLHFRNNDRSRMVVGQTFTIEPILTIGGIEDETWDDNWTVVTADGSLAAQFEHTLLITEKGVEILTVA
ncbi:hypothetical protein KP509_07G099100 [Ceratopteris richardii]|uniref:Methionine aminopeptidase n=1 Tax=Ceratopteris richardii TaxID=49495 RepID=A0A8T2UP92_CERRI|nr:hypothetical protein KP509_07G099100 [Ceratopteris richardii]